MNDEKSVFSVPRVTAALILMAALSTIIYTLTSYGTRLFFPSVFVVAGFASCFTLFVFLPLISLLMAMRRTGLVTVVLTIFSASFAIFFIWNYVTLSQSDDYVYGARVMVEAGVLNSSGYLNILADALVTSASEDVFAEIGAVATKLLCIP